jgi:proteasome lid subunit RPN8/RPN11
LSTPFKLHIPRQIYQEMLVQARAELPNECCGLLAGPTLVHASSTGLLVSKRYPLRNEKASPVEFWSEPRDMFDAVRDMRRLGIDILAVYHSHPGGEPTPSKTDLERNYSPEVMNLIISLTGTAPRVRAWWLSADGFREAEFVIV